MQLKNITIIIDIYSIYAILAVKYLYAGNYISKIFETKLSIPEARNRFMQKLISISFFSTLEKNSIIRSYKLSFSIFDF